METNGYSIDRDMYPSSEDEEEGDEDYDDKNADKNPIWFNFLTIKKFYKSDLKIDYFLSCIRNIELLHNQQEW